MIADKLASSFGDPNVHPPTPRDTPTSVVFPSPIFRTPRNNQGSLDSPGGGWTPRFAEDYSVFNATPGNLKGSSGAFVDLASGGPCHSSTGPKRALNPEDIAAEVASHVNHFSPNPNLPLPPVEPSRRLPSSPGLPIFQDQPRESQPSLDSQDSERFSKKVRLSAAGEGTPAQTATPPPTGRRGKAQPKPRLRTNKMQNDQGYPHPDFINAPSQSNMNNFEFFEYPMSAPAADSSFDNGRHFWEPEAMGMEGMEGMEIDFTVSADVFSPSHRPIGSMGSFDWSRGNEMFQEPSVIPQSQENIPPPATTAASAPIAPTSTIPDSAASSKPPRALAPKPSASTAVGNAAPEVSGSFTASMDDPFATGASSELVNPGVLFSRPPSSSMEAAPFNPMAHIPVTQSLSQPEPLHRPLQKLAPKTELRRSVSTREVPTSKPNGRAPLNPPFRPGLQRSFSENRGKKQSHRASLPTLAPAIRPDPGQLAPMTNARASSIHVASRPIAQPRGSGRTSPLKRQHRRLPSLTSIPETGPRRQLTDAKLVIDARGRAHIEPIIVSGDLAEYPRRREANHQSHGWDSSNDDSSDTDDEPIIIPSRNTSFALPDPLQVKPSASFHASQRSFSERSTNSFGSFNVEPRHLENDGDSDAETVMNEPRGKQLGDAVSELRKLVEHRQKRSIQVGNGGASRAPKFVSGSYTYNGNLASPTSLTESSAPTPSTSSHSSIRCLCARAMERDSEYMVQCESCENWLHGKCININRQNHPRVYICAFCAQTPMRNGRIKAGTGNPTAPGTIPSPLAHKSFKFR